MKIKTLVKFLGYGDYKPLESTYVYGVRGDIILIAHPDGLSSDDEKVKEHLLKHYNLAPKTTKRFVEAKIEELVVLKNSDGTEATTELQTTTTTQVQLPDAETFVDEVVSIQVPKSFLLNVKQYFVAQKQSMDPNAEIPGVPSFVSKAIKSFMSKNQKEVLELSEYMISSVDSAMQTIQQGEVETTVNPEPIVDTKAIEPAVIIDNAIAPIETAPETIKPEPIQHIHV